MKTLMLAGIVLLAITLAGCHVKADPLGPGECRLVVIDMGAGEVTDTMSIAEAAACPAYIRAEIRR